MPSTSGALISESFAMGWTILAVLLVCLLVVVVRRCLILELCFMFELGSFN
jgi:hypothetical protein